MAAVLSACCFGSRRSTAGFRQGASSILLSLILAQTVLFTAADPSKPASVKKPSEHVVAGVREQCGGLLWSGALHSGAAMDAPYPQVVCAKGLKCHRDSKWYYECIPEEDKGFAWKLDEVLQGSATTKTMVDVMAEVEGESQEGNKQTVMEKGDQKDIFDTMDVMEKTMKQKVKQNYKEAAKMMPGLLRGATAEIKKVAAAVGSAKSQKPAVSKDVLDTMKEQTSAAERPVMSGQPGSASRKLSEEMDPEFKLAMTLAAWSRRRLSSSATAELYKNLGITDDMTEQYGQCGGKINAPSTDQSKDAVWDGAQCWPGWACSRVNEWYYQCIPQPGSGSRPPTFQEVDGQKKLVLDVWAQCGGKGGQVPDDESPVDGPYPSRVCFADTDCTRQNEWYWQCLPNKNFGPVGPTPGPGPNPNPVPVYPSPSIYVSPPALVPVSYYYYSPPADIPAVYSPPPTYGIPASYPPQYIASYTYSPPVYKVTPSP